MTTVSKRFTIAGALVLLVVVIIALVSAPPDNRHYRAESCVITRTYSDVLFARSFEADVIRTTPDILRLRVTPTFDGIPGGGTPVVANGVEIRVFTAGPTAQVAQRAANEAATQVCRTVVTNHGMEGLIAEPAHSARRFSFFHDSFQPGIARLFGH